MNIQNRRRKREKINARRAGKFKKIHSVDELCHGQLVAGNRWSWSHWDGNPHFSHDERIPAFRHRMGPVPGIHHSGGWRSNYRRPRIKNLLVIADKKLRRFEEPEHREPAARRKARHLPVAFDDRQRATVKNWKAYRKTQWKPIEG